MIHRSSPFQPQPEQSSRPLGGFRGAALRGSHQPIIRRRSTQPMPKKNLLPERKASFIESMECLPVPTVPEGPEWTYEILCGGPHKISYVALTIML
jgi:hypothetical protein